MADLVFGASSQIGHFLLPRLVAQGGEVIALSRQARNTPSGVHWLLGSLPEAPLPQTPLRAVFCFGALPQLLPWLAKLAPGSVRQIIVTSSMSAQTKQHSAVPAERVLSALLRDTEQAVAAASATLGAHYTVLRPTVVYGAGLDRSLTPIARRALRTHVLPLPLGRGLRQPVHAEDLALAALAALDNPAAYDRVFEAGGGERLKIGQMFNRVRRSVPGVVLPLPLPGWMLQGAGALWPRLRGPLSRLDTDLIADNRELTARLGITPRPFQPDAACWQAPA